MYRSIFIVVLLLAPLPALGFDFDEPPISYRESTPSDPVARLQARIDKGEAKLEHSPEFGYLPAVLRELGIPTSSQSLVFSKNSLQRDRISPERPRAIYFDDETYVAFVQGPGGLLEIATTDPQLGTVFYAINQGRPMEMPRFNRETADCLACHSTTNTGDVPGVFMRSVYPDATGGALLPAGTFVNNHASAMSERWGGWYVTGSVGGQTHMGNTIWKKIDGEDQYEPTVLAAQDATELPSRVDRTKYLTPHSDVVALMVLAHQAEAHNRFTRAVYATKLALRDEKVLADALKEQRAPGQHSESTLRRINNNTEPLVEYLLLSGEPPLAAPVAGTSTFPADFSARGPRDTQGRSLRDFDLQTRLFRYPLSYLIYSRTFDEMPELVKQRVYGRLWEILSGQDTSKPYAHLTPGDRQAVMEILRDTKIDLPEYWSRSDGE
jgi:hypothetical protein